MQNPVRAGTAGLSVDLRGAPRNRLSKKLFAG
jgi:hypothetical protein